MRQQLHPVEQSRYPFFFSPLYLFSPPVFFHSSPACFKAVLCWLYLHCATAYLSAMYRYVVPYLILPNTDNSASSTWTGRELVLKSQGTCIHLSDRTPKRPHGGYQGSKQALPNASITPVRYGKLRPFARSLTFSQPRRASLSLTLIYFQQSEAQEDVVATSIMIFGVQASITATDSATTGLSRISR